MALVVVLDNEIGRILSSAGNRFGHNMVSLHAEVVA